MSFRLGEIVRLKRILEHRNYRILGTILLSVSSLLLIQDTLKRTKIRVRFVPNWTEEKEKKVLANGKQASQHRLTQKPQYFLTERNTLGYSKPCSALALFLLALRRGKTLWHCLITLSLWMMRRCVAALIVNLVRRSILLAADIALSMASHIINKGVTTEQINPVGIQGLLFFSV